MLQQGIRSSSLDGRVRVAGSRFPRGSSPRGDAIRDLYGLPLYTGPPPLLRSPAPTSHPLKPCMGCPVAPRVGMRYKFRGWKSRVIYIHARERANCIYIVYMRDIYRAPHRVLYSSSSSFFPLALVCHGKDKMDRTMAKGLAGTRGSILTARLGYGGYVAEGCSRLSYTRLHVAVLRCSDD